MVGVKKLEKLKKKTTNKQTNLKRTIQPPNILAVNAKVRFKKMRGRQKSRTKYDIYPGFETVF